MPLVVLHGTANGLDTAAPSVLYGAGGAVMTSGDLNGDGYADLAVLTGRGIATFHGSATGLGTTGAPTLDGRWKAGTPLVAHDSDGDGYDELLANGVVVAKGGSGGAAPVG
jgi:hypothetical protein